MKNIFLYLLLCSLSCLTTLADNVPTDHVFVVERNKNANRVCYDVNLQNGSLCLKEPLKSYWMGEGWTDGLTFLDRKMAFGVKILSTEKDKASVHLTAYKDLIINICKRGGKWVGIVRLHGHEMVLQKLFAQMKAPLYIRCEYVDVYGIDTTTGEKRRERIMP